MTVLRWPRIRSFRLRIALMSTFLALAAVIVLYIVASTTLVNRRAAIIDRMMQAHLAGPGFGANNPALWPAIDTHLNASFGAYAPLGTETGFAILSVHDARRGTVYRSALWPTALPEAELPDDGELVDRQADGNTWRIGQVRRGPMLVQIGVNRSLATVQLKSALSRFWLGIIAVSGVVGLASWFLAGRAMRPIEHLTKVMVRLNASDLQQRASAADEAQEFEQLVQVFNAMLDRLERSFLQAIRFSGDAAHELKTPLTILRGELERAFKRAHSDPQLEQELAGMLDEIQRLDSIVRKLLLLSRADAGQLQVPMVPLDLQPILSEQAEDVELMAPERAVRLDLPAAMPSLGDAVLLRQVLHNLVSNAVKYGTADGWIALTARRVGGSWQIDVANASEGIPADNQEGLFNRFYRADAAHSRRVGGVGLGLSLAREIARAHGGELYLAEAGPPHVCFRLTLPAVS